jgi:hypothetical protein
MRLDLPQRIWEVAAGLACGPSDEVAIGVWDSGVWFCGIDVLVLIARLACILQ